MKLSPQRVKFCPGCPKKDLKLSEPKFVVLVEEKDMATSKVQTIIKPSVKKKLKGGLF